MPARYEAIARHVRRVARLGPQAYRLPKVRGYVYRDKRSRGARDWPQKLIQVDVVQAVQWSSPFEQHSRGLEWIPKTFEVKAELPTQRGRRRQQQRVSLWTTDWTKSATNDSQSCVGVNRHNPIRAHDFHGFEQRGLFARFEG